MTKNPIALTIALAFATSITLYGCDSTANLTEQEHIQRAKDFEDKGNLKGSIVELKNAIQKNPESPQARLLLGQLYLKVGMGNEAEKELSRAETLGVQRESVKPLLGEALLLMGEYKRVLDEIQPSEKTTKANLALILHLRANALLMQGKVKDACELFQMSLDSDVNNPPAYWGLAQCAIAERDLEKAKTLLDAALKIRDKQAKTWTFVGSLELLKNNTDGALIAYKNALQIEPTNLEALDNIASINIGRGNFDDASKNIAAMRKLAPKSIQANYLQALLSYQKKKYSEANDVLQESFKITNDHYPSILLAGMTAYSLGLYQQAESNFNRFLSRFPRNKLALKGLAATQIKQSQPDKALATLGPFIASDVRDAQALALAADAYLLKNESAKAAEYLRIAADISPKNASIQTKLGLSHLVARDIESAIRELETAAALDPDQYNADTYLVLAHLSNKEYDKALIAINALEEKLKDNPITHNMRGRAYLGKKDIASARKSFEHALSIDATFFPAAANLAELDIGEKRPDSARVRFENILKKERNNLQAIMALAELAAQQKQEKEYIHWLEKAVETNPNAVAPRIALVRHHLAKKETQKALVLATETVRTNPESVAALDILGTVQIVINDRNGAIATFTKLAAKASNSPDAHLRLAVVQINYKDFKAARAALIKALQIKPDHLQSQLALVGVELAEKRPEAALKIARQIQARLPTSPVGFSQEAEIQLSQKRMPEAIKAYEQALAKGAGSAIFTRLHRAYTLAGNDRLAEQTLSNWLKQHPNDMNVRSYAAANYMMSGNNKQAIAQYQEILRSAPSNVVALNNLASLYFMEKDGRALATAEQALKIAPDSLAIQDTAGWILVELGQAQRGLDLLRKAVAQAPKMTSIRYHYAVALARVGENALARKELEKLLLEVPKFPDADAARTLLRSL